MSGSGLYLRFIPEIFGWGWWRGLLRDEKQGLVLIEAEGKRRGQLSSDKDGASGLYLLDENRKSRASIGTRKDGAPYFDLSDAKGNVIWQAPR